MAGTREAIETYLSKRQGWQIKDKAGGAGTKLAQAIGANAGRTNQVLREMEREGTISRDTTARRTYAIRLNKPTPNGREPAAEVSEEEDYVKTGLGILQAAANALRENDELKATVKAQKKDLEHVRSQLQAAELANAAMERQVTEAKATAERVAAGLSTDVKRDVQALLTKVKRLG